MSDSSVTWKLGKHCDLMKITGVMGLSAPSCPFSICVFVGWYGRVKEGQEIKLQVPSFEK